MRREVENGSHRDEFESHWPTCYLLVLLTFSKLESLVALERKLERNAYGFVWLTPRGLTMYAKKKNKLVWKTFNKIVWIIIIVQNTDQYLLDIRFIETVFALISVYIFRVYNGR